MNEISFSVGITVEWNLPDLSYLTLRVCCSYVMYEEFKVKQIVIIRLNEKRNYKYAFTISNICILYDWLIVDN